jgi:nucleoside-diphosphate-sugar epimerase
MTSALVFGGSGQIGMALLERLRAADWDVHALSRQPLTEPSGVHWLRGEFARMPPLPDAVDVIFSCGPLDQFARWHAQANIRCPRVVAFGSSSVHVKQDSSDPGERDVARRLHEAEALLFASGRERGAAVTVLRPTLVYGSGRDATLTRIVRIARRFGRFVLPCGAEGLRQPVHVEDLAGAAITAASRPATNGRGYDLPGGETLPYREMIRRVLACQSPPLRLHALPSPLFRMLLAAARTRGIARDLTADAIARMREDLAFDAEPAHRDFGYAPRAFVPTARMFGEP